MGDVCVCVYICMHQQVYMYSCACSRSSHPIGLYPVMTCEYSQGGNGRTALQWASARGHEETVRVLVELGASLEAVDKVSIHAHALAYTCCVKHVSGIMRMTIIIMSHVYAYYVYLCIHVCVCVCVCMIHICAHTHAHTNIRARKNTYNHTHTHTHTHTHA
jgi:hypothetical protein